jgi:branched-subunit amino acid ABC-type transport system permease component
MGENDVTAAIRLTGGLAFILALYIFSAATGYVAWSPVFGHADLGVIGWLTHLIFIPLAYVIGLTTGENPPPHPFIAAVLSSIAGLGVSLMLSRTLKGRSTRAASDNQN